MTQTPPGPYLVGKTFVTLTVTSHHGESATCRATVTVIDDTPPKIKCPENIVISTDPGQCSAVVKYPAPMATDNCSGLYIFSDPAPGSTFQKGTTRVTITAIDGSGNKASCSFNVTVADQEPPQIACPPDIVVGNDPGQCSAIVNYSGKAADNCGNVTVTWSPPSGSIFPKGLTIVTGTARDDAGNVSSCSFTVTVKDIEAPLARCTPTTNPAGKNIPTAGENPKSGQNPDGFYQLGGGDNCDSPSAIGIYIKDSASDFVQVRSKMETKSRSRRPLE
ncbi:MAG: HYR domain-containing protein [Verrucomicrobia bacterium]|nr:HYR domain-containing protein [Verrucomicrobiota bacterium]